MIGSKKIKKLLDTKIKVWYNVGVGKIKGDNNMILKDMLNRIDDDTVIALVDNNGVFIDYDFPYTIDERYNNCEVIFPISVKNNKIEIWIDIEVA